MTTAPDVDLMDPWVFTNGIPHDYFRALRQRPGLHHVWDTDGTLLWHVVRHREVVEISRNTNVFSSSPTTMTSVRQESAGLPIITFLDPPEHSRLRRLTANAFTRARMNALAGPVRDIVDRIVAELSTRDGFDVAEDIALDLPLEVLAELIGIPAEDRRTVLALARQTINLGDPDYEHSTPEAGGQAFYQIFTYLQELATRRASAPRDDMISILLAAEAKGSRLDATEIAQFCTTLMSAGSETTYCSVTGGLLALLEHPDQLALLRADRSLIPTAVTEILRWVSPVTHFARNVRHDNEIGGQPIRAGERVAMWYTSANFDEDVFTDPLRFDVTRDPNPQLAFGGGGPHVCIGNVLAVLELRLLLESLVDRLPDMELTGEPVRTRTNFMNSIRYMPARLR